MERQNAPTSKNYRIGEAAERLEIGIDTLRYYEKIRLVPRATRGKGGVRVYTEPDLARLRFIRRAQGMGFSLDDIRLLLELRRAPAKARAKARALAARKLAEITERLKEIKQLEGELRLLLNLCDRSGGGCPIIEGIERNDAHLPRRIKSAGRRAVST